MKPEEILREIENQSKEQFLPIIGPHKADIFRKVLRKYKPKVCLEIGTLVGYSAIVIADELPEHGRLTTIEIDKSSASIAADKIARAGLSSKVEVLLGDARKLIPKLKQKFDLVFIDAIKEEYLEYLRLAEKNLGKGSVVVADNVKVFASYMADYLDYVRSSGKYQSTYIDVPLSEDGMEVSVKL